MLLLVKQRIFIVLVLSCFISIFMLSISHIFTHSLSLNLGANNHILTDRKKLPSAKSFTARVALLTTRKVSANNTNFTTEMPSAYDDKIYVMAAYVISSSLIRLTIIRKCKTTIKLQLHLRINRTHFFVIPLIHRPILKCPWFYAKKCDFVGYYADTVRWNELDRLLTADKTLPSAYISRVDRPSLQIPILLQDARAVPNKLRKHQLAICLQPIFLLADWTLLVQFFEVWIAQGATKFYIYVQSLAPEVDALLRVYEHSKDVDIERIYWAPLPTPEGDPGESDPNLRVYRGEVVTSINDCVLRSRGHAKYVISTDLDEIIIAYEERSLLKLIDNLHSKLKKSAAFVIRSSFALYENHWAEVTQPTEINFNGFANILLENYTWPAGYRSKVIMIPEYIHSTHVHQVLAPEGSKKVTVVAPETALVFHLRRVMRDELWSSDSTVSTDALTRFIEPCNKSWKNRLKTINKFPDTKILHKNNWPNRGTRVMEEIEACREQLQSMQNDTCQSPYYCMSKITSVSADEWFVAKQTWIVL